MFATRGSKLAKSANPNVCLEAPFLPFLPFYARHGTEKGSPIWTASIDKMGSQLPFAFPPLLLGHAQVQLPALQIDAHYLHPHLIAQPKPAPGPPASQAVRRLLVI